MLLRLCFVSKEIPPEKNINRVYLLCYKNVKIFISIAERNTLYKTVNGVKISTLTALVLGSCSVLFSFTIANDVTEFNHASLLLPDIKRSPTIGNCQAMCFFIRFNDVI